MSKDLQQYRGGLVAGFVIGMGVAFILIAVVMRAPVQADGDKTQKVEIVGTVDVKIVGPVSNGKPIRIKQVK